MTEVPNRRFLKLEEVAEIFSTSLAQTYALVRRGDLRAIKLGGRGQWRVELAEVEKFIERAYADTEEYIGTHPMTDSDMPGAPDGEEGCLSENHVEDEAPRESDPEQ